MSKNVSRAKIDKKWQESLQKNLLENILNTFTIEKHI